MTEIEKLKETYSTDGVTIHLLYRIGEYALVINHTTDGNYFQGFEVHKIKERQKRVVSMGGHKIVFPAKESYVPSSQFGFHALHYPNLDLVYRDFPQFKQYDGKIRLKLRNN